MSSGSPLSADVVVVTVNYRTPELTMRCLAALRRERAGLPNLRAVVVDGGSADGSADILERATAAGDYADWVTFLPLEINGGFGWANNQAILTLARGGRAPDYIHILNPDAEVMSQAVTLLVEELQAHPRCAAVGSQLFNSAGREAASAFRFPSTGREFAAAASAHRLRKFLGIAPGVVTCARSCEADWVTGASVMFRTEALRESGLFDDGFFLYFEEVELMYRLRKRGWSVRYVPESHVVHSEGAATGLGSAATRPPPPYWYQSRRRYFTLTGGPLMALAADLAALAGRSIALLKAIVGRQSPPGALLARDLIRFGFWRQSRDRGAVVSRLGDAPGRPPTWMSVR